MESKYKFAIERCFKHKPTLEELNKAIIKNKHWSLHNKYQSQRAALQALKQLNYNRLNNIGWYDVGSHIFNDAQYYSGAGFRIVHYY